MDTVILEKLHRIATAVDAIEKQGTNEHHHYSYARAEDVVRKLKAMLLNEGLVILTSAANARHEPAIGGRGMVTTVELCYLVADTTTGETLSMPWVGVGSDTGGDKGIYKAYTGGFKYALLALFMLPTTDDPEKDDTTVAPTQHKDDARPPATTIPMDRAQAILAKAVEAKLAVIVEGGPPVLTPTFQAKLAHVEAEDGKITLLNVDQAEDVEAFLTTELANA